LQYAAVKLHLPEAHHVNQGDHVLVAVIDSGVDRSHPELSGSFAAAFDATNSGLKADTHGTAVAGSIVAHAKLTGSAPKALILAVQAFNAADGADQGTTFNILKGLDWAAVKGARVINMSFAGPFDPAMHRSLQSAFNNAIVLIAAAGNSGPKSPPLFPGADNNVVAVTATDQADRIFAASNRGNYISLAAPGVDLLLAAPGNAYRIDSGTSFSAAEISGIAALVLEKQPGLPPDKVRTILLASGKALGGPGAPRLANAFQALSAIGERGPQLDAGR
jgi:subtilisin family serine protease